MRFNSENITEALFENLPYSKKSDEIRDKISCALEEEYTRLSKDESELKAAGIVIQEFSTIEEAAQRAGCTEEEITQLTNRENITDKSALKKLFRKQRIVSYIFAISAIMLFSSTINIFLNFHWAYITMAVIFGLFTALMLVKYSRHIKKTEGISLLPEAGEYIRIVSDSYSKKLVNSIFILIGFVFYFAVSLFYLTRFSESKGSEVLGQISILLGYFNYAVYFVIKNLLCRRLCRQYVTDKINKPFMRSLKQISLLSLAYWILGIIVLVLLINFSKFTYNLLTVIILIFSLLALCYNFTFRGRTVFKNIRWNIKRAVAYVVVITVFIVYQAMGMDSYLIQPYISKIPQIEHTESDIIYNDETGVYTITTDKDTFRILQLTDIHLGGSIISAEKDLKALQTVYELIEYARPDLVVVTGDLVFPMGIMSFSRNNATPVVQFANFMRNIGIPWAFTYGNHDTETMATLTADSLDVLMKSVSFKSSGNFLYPYIQPDIWGRNNQLIEVRNADDGTLMQALFLIDSNAYVEGPGINEYDFIHDDQVAWYERQITKLNASEGKIIPSMAFFHIPLQEYQEAYELYQNGSDEVKYYHGIIGETMINPICCSEYPSKFFDKAVELGSTKAMFCGHDHYNNLSVEYKGIRLTYGYSIDYLAMPGIENDIDQRGATIISIDKSGNFEITPIQYKNLLQHTK